MRTNHPIRSTRRRLEKHAPRVLSRMFLIAAVLLIGKEIFRGTSWVRWLAHLFGSVTFPFYLWGLGAGVFMLILSASLRRCKRTAWWFALIFLGINAVVPVWYDFVVLRDLIVSGAHDYPQDLESYMVMTNGITVPALMGYMIASRRRFRAQLTPGNLRRAVMVLIGGLMVSIGAGFLLGMMFQQGVRPRGRFVGIMRYLLRLEEPELAQTAPHWVQLVTGLLVSLTLVCALLVLMRSQRQLANLPLDEELEARTLLASNPEDSLGYFNLRRDKQLIFSANRRSAIAYRVQLGVCLAAGDPLGHEENWPAAIETWLEMVHSYGWVPGVVGASEPAAAAYEAAGLHPVRVGDEAILRPDLFDLNAREMKPVRTAVQRLVNAGYTVHVRRHKDIDPDELAHLFELAERWRDGEDRGFSMALNRLGDPLDGDMMMVEARFGAGHDGEERVAGLLSFCPWGPDGLSLDVMRRNPESDNGITELMVSELMARGRDLKISRVSLNFAVLRSMIEEGERVGATPLARFERRLVLLFSRWFQIEQLYRSNQKYRPLWSPRYMVFEDPADMGQVGAAMGVAEGYLDLPGWLNPVPVVVQRLVPADDPRVVAFLERPTFEVTPVKLPEQVRLRFEARERMLAAGQQPYPVGTGVDAHCCDIERRRGQRLTVAGRVLGISDHGGVVFLRLQDGSGRSQAVIERDVVGPESLTELSHRVQLGDQVSVTGLAGESRTGTSSLLVESWTLISKCLRPMPDKHKGIADPEALVRQRYLDLIVNPSSKQRLVARSKAIQAVRETLLEESFLEVETPILQTIHGGANARPFTTHINAYDLDLYLRIAPELYLKRLMVGGMDRVFEIGKNFRNEGADATHNPEFTVLEAYAANGDYHSMRRLTEQLVRRAAVAVTGSTVVRGRGADGVEVEVDLAEDWAWIPVHEGISRGLGEEVTIDTPRAELVRHCRRLGIEVDPRATRGGVLDELYDVFCEKPTTAPTFYCDFPAEVSPLTRPHRDDPRLAERWDLVVFGSELGTAYSELIDPVIQRQRLTEQSLQAAGGDAEAMELDEDFLVALEYGMPPTGGLGIGLDRLVMMLTQASIRETIAFPLVRPRVR